MEIILKDINAVAGVMGSYVCNGEGQILGSAMPARFDEPTLATIGRTIMQTVSGMESLRRRKVGDLVFVFQQGSVIVKNLGESCLFILCNRNINVPLLNLTANLVVKKLTEKLKISTPAPTVGHAPPLVPKVFQVPVPTPAPATIPTAGEVSQAANLDGAFLTQVEHELTRMMGPVALIIIDEELAAIGAGRDGLPREQAAGLLEKLSAEIGDDTKRSSFIKTVLKALENA
jgi:predicted regulator of Ras-like GTPase activity (Roadblock/LC7/MglB family)